MTRLVEALRRSPNSQEQRQAATRHVFGEIAELAPQDRLLKFTSSTLAPTLLDRASEPNSPLQGLVRILDLQPTDPVEVYVPPHYGEDPTTADAVWIQRGAFGKTVQVEFDPKTLQLRKVGLLWERDNLTNAIGDANSREMLLLQTFEVMKADLLKRRGEWREGMRVKRDEFADQLRELGKRPAVAVDRVLSAFAEAFPDQEYAVLGLIDKSRVRDDSPDKDKHRVKLFTTMPLTEDLAGKVENETQSISDYTKQSLYTNNFHPHIAFEGVVGPHGYSINPRRLVMDFKGYGFSTPHAPLQIALESFYPAVEYPIQWHSYSEKVQDQPKDNPNDALEKHFGRFLAGGEAKFLPITGLNQEATLLSTSPNTPFKTPFLNKSGDYGA